jgi:hypothetical protein
METTMKRLPYERQGFSQNYETGIIEYMLAGISAPTKTFVEIGFGDGTQNMTLDLLHQGYCGVGIDGWDWDPSVVERWPDQLIKVQKMISPDNVAKYIPEQYWQPDFFSLDIDSFDYEVASTLLQSGFRPATVCCEINKNFGDERASFPYVKNPIKKVTYNRRFLYGCSLSKYKDLWSQYGYEFFTFDTRAVNGFWFHPEQVSIDLDVARNQSFGTVIDTSIIKQQIADHQYWGNKQHEIYQTI